MILNGDEIQKAYDQGLIVINPFDPKRIGPNSYDVVLDDTLLFYEDDVLDPRRENPTRKIKIPESGYVLSPGDFALGSTFEQVRNDANHLVPMIEGRSSIARLGLAVHVTAGFGDLGFCGKWTLEFSAAKSVRIYPRMPIAQLYWIQTNPTTRQYKGKYQGQNAVTASRIEREFGDAMPTM